MRVRYPKLYNMAHLLSLNVLLLPKDLTIIFICTDHINRKLHPRKLVGMYPTSDTKCHELAIHSAYSQLTV